MAKREWFWYICRANELLLDVDSKWRRDSALRKLERADVPLQIINVWCYPSYSEGKWHIACRLAQDTLTDRQRILWAWWAGSDSIRAMYSLTRCEYGLQAPDLLIAPRRWVQYWREPDFTCGCAQKHIGTEACRACPVFQKIHGSHAGAVYYPLTPLREIQPGVQIWPPREK